MTSRQFLDSSGVPKAHDFLAFRGRIKGVMDEVRRTGELQMDQIDPECAGCLRGRTQGETQGNAGVESDTQSSDFFKFGG